VTTESDDTLEEGFEMAIRARLGTAMGLAMAAVALVVAPALAWEPRVAGMP
jgi:hypothetical protein